MNRVIDLLIFFSFILISSINGQWLQTNGPYGGKVNCLTISGNILYAGTYDGVFKSTNNGTNWRKIDLENNNIKALTKISSNLFAATDGNGVFLSVNEGNSWTQVNNGLANKNVQTFAVLNNNLFAGTKDGVFHSTNLGSNWIEVSNGLTNKNVHCFSFSGNNILAGTDDGVFISSNYGINWIPINNGIRNTTVYFIAVSSSGIFIATDSSGVLRSTNMGSSWQQTNLNNITVLALTFNGNVLLAGTYGSGIFRSTDNGTSWTMVNNGLTNNYILSFVVDGSGNIFCGTFDGIFYSSNNGISWVYRSTDLTNTAVNAIAYLGTDIFCGTDNGIFLTTNTGTNWVEIGLNDQFILCLTVYSSNIFAGSRGVFVSTNNGVTWTSRGLEYSDINSIDVIYPRIFASTDRDVFRSSFASSNWESVFYLSMSSPNTILTHKDSILFLGTVSGIYSSTNYGTNWQKIGFMMFVNSIAFCDTFILAGTNDGLYRKGFNEVNWSKIALHDTIVRVLVTAGNKLFAGTNYGVFLSNNNGINWTDVSTGLTNKRVLCLAVSSKNLLAGTYAGGVWRRPLGEMITSLSQTNNDIRTDFVLEQNYPNPFNPSTKIIFTIPNTVILSGAKNLVTLKIYDLLGNEVATLIDEYKSAGSYEVEFDAAQTNSLCSGVYFYQLKVGDFIQTRKMVLIP